MSNTFFTSDLHFGHEKVAEHRGFATAAEHDDFLVKQWRNVVKPDDTVWVLGDLATNAHDYALDLVQSLPGTKHLISGNHDPVHPMHRRSHNYIHKYLTAFDSVQPFAKRRIDGRSVLLSHFPYMGEGADHTLVPRHTQWRLPNEGEWLLHGHTHLDDQTLHRKQIHVGVDAHNLAPLPIGEVIEYMKSYYTAQADQLDGKGTE